MFVRVYLCVYAPLCLRSGTAWPSYMVALWAVPWPCGGRMTHGASIHACVYDGLVPSQWRNAMH